MSEQKTKKCCKLSFLFLVLFTLFILFVLYVAFFLTANTTNENGANIDVNTEANIKNNVDENQEEVNEQLSEEKENIISYSFDANDKEGTAFSGLLNYGEENDIEIEYNNSEYGVFVESLNGINDENDEKFWLYYVNDSLGDVAADKKILEEGDEVEWRFEEMPF